MEFIERIELILDGRKISPWAKSLGLGASFVARAKENKTPNADALSVIGLTERVSISWLLTGQGNPFLVANLNSDESIAEYLDEISIEKGWHVHLLTAIESSEDQWPYSAIILTMASEIEKGKTKIGYFSHEVISGPIQHRTHEVLMEKYEEFFEIMISKESLDNITKGLAGNKAVDIATGFHVPDEEMDSMHKLLPDDLDKNDKELEEYFRETSLNITQQRIIKDFENLNSKSKKKAQQVVSELVKIISS